jgi:protein-S-isoprenylcysteine O-methyltransferase Ste14
MTSESAALLTLLAVAAYGALHSLLASRWAKARARSHLGPASGRLYRLAYNLIGGLTLLPVLAIPARFPGRLLVRVPWPWSGLMLAVQAGALLVILLGVRQTGIGSFLGLRQLLEGSPDDHAPLVVTGLYRWVRHPLYTAGLVFLWLSPIMTTSTLALVAGLSAYIYIGSFFEERRLAAHFGQVYRDYQRRVPRLLPRPRPPIDPAAARPPER